MRIHATSDGGRASLYEFEAWEPGDDNPHGKPRNVALAAHGSRASSSSFALENQTRHPDNLIDGKLRDDDRFPWIAKETGDAWVLVEFPRAVPIDRIVWQRGFGGFPVDYDIELKRPDGTWLVVADTQNRLPHIDDRRDAEKLRLKTRRAMGGKSEPIAVKDELNNVPRTAIEELVATLEQQRQANARLLQLITGPQVFAGTFQSATATYVLDRGNPMQRSDIVEPDVPSVLGSLDLPSDTPERDRRVALARHITNPDHPLMARVIANRIWQHHFGTGLVDTPSDFGSLGERPSHPRLLDWLANELIRKDWSLKHLHRLILTSNTFRQSSVVRERALAIDADSRLLWRFPPRQLEAEAIRDSVLQASGRLNLEMHGVGFDFFNQKGGLSDYKPRTTFDPSGYRRMVYATKIRMQPVDVFGAFDCPDAGQMIAKRTRSITPVQALGLLNSDFVMRQAKLFAERINAEVGEEPKKCVRRAVELAVSRLPTQEESRDLTRLCRQFGLVQVCRVLLNANEFVFLQ